MQRRRRGYGDGSGGVLSVRCAGLLLLLLFSAVVWAGDPLRVCIYGDNRGSNAVHRAILKEARVLNPRFFVIVGDVLKFDYGRQGTPEAVLNDYRAILGTRVNPLVMWPLAPGPAIFPVAGGHDEQFFLDPDIAAVADQSPARRYAYEGTTELGVLLYDAFDLEQMRLRVQPIHELSKPLPMSRYGDYLVLIGPGPRREMALLVLYRTDRWSFREDQVAWVDSVLTSLRAVSPTLPLVVCAHDWTWFLPDELDDGSTDGVYNAVREGTPEADRELKQRLLHSLARHGADVAIASDSHAYWADTTAAYLRINCGAAICTDQDGERVARDNVWLEYFQDATRLQVIVHPINPPIGCGLDSLAALSGTHFVKNRAPGARWRVVNP